MKKYWLILVCFWLAVACSSPEKPAVNVVRESESLTQISTFDALLQGVYDGTFSLDDMAGNGDFGIGTFDKLDGEMIFTNGKFYQVKADGKVYQPERSVKTPFASVCFFKPETKCSFAGLNYVALKQKIDSMMPSRNYFYAIRVKGSFARAHTRSVPAQSVPYPPLVEVTKNQPEFQSENLSGMLIGFYCPDYVKGINVPGYHLHFLSDDEQFGGHVLDFQLSSGTLELQKLDHFEMLLPKSGAFLHSEYKTDRSAEVKQVEGSVK